MVNPERHDRAMWDERYGKPGFSYGTAPNAFLASMAHHLPPGRILSIGEGEGRNAVYLATRGYQVVGVDGSPVGMAKAQRLAADHAVRITTEVADLADYRIDPATWDGIISIFCHLPRRLRARVHADVVQGLKVGGVFILEAYTPAQLEYGTGGPPTVDLLVSLADLERELEGLQFLHAEETEREVIEGRAHTGPSAVVQVVAVKQP